MQVITKSNFDCETVALMGRVCDDAWRDLQATMFFPLPSDAEETLHRIAARIMAAVAEGERDPTRLKAIAMDGFELR
jgi:hypothetical protein